MPRGKYISRLDRAETELVLKIAGEIGKLKLPSERELARAGRLGVLKARRNYRASKGDFGKYAGWWIRNSMRMCVLRKLNP
jgi:DNA-directed RNA polymerase sigma subunit (sigma70/sigma32)